MELTPSVVRDKAEEYETAEPLAAVEAEQVETFSAAVASGDYGWRDAEWIVQWYYRRYLGAFPDDRRRAAESAYGANDFEAVRDALEAASVAADSATVIDRLTELAGVDVPVASAFLMFIDPDDSIVVGEREWSVLESAGHLDRPLPEPVTVADYEEYLGVCRELSERFDCTMWTLYRGLWRLWKDEHE